MKEKELIMAEVIVNPKRKIVGIGSVESGVWFWGDVGMGEKLIADFKAALETVKK